MFQVVYSTSHWFVPKVIIVVVIILGLAIIITEGLTRKKEGKPFFVKGNPILGKGYNKLKFWGTIVLFILYVMSMEWFGFLPASLVFIFLFNVLFCASKKPKSLITSAIISVTASVCMWYVFGMVFNISLPVASLF